MAGRRRSRERVEALHRLSNALLMEMTSRVMKVCEGDACVPTRLCARGGLGQWGRSKPPEREY